MHCHTFPNFLINKQSFWFHHGGQPLLEPPSRRRQVLPAVDAWSAVAEASLEAGRCDIARRVGAVERK